MLYLAKYRFLSFLREKVVMFWGFAFPIILCTLFYVSFGNIDNTLKEIDTAVVVKSEAQEAKAFQSFLEAMADEEELIKPEIMKENEAKEKLRDGKVFGIYYVDTEPELTVAGNGIEESVLQELLAAYQSKIDMIETVAAEKPEKLADLVGQISEEGSYREYAKEASLGGKTTDGMIQYFFSLIGMTCMFGCFLGFSSVMDLQPNISALGARRCSGATSKFKLLTIDFVLICLINFAETVVLIGYMSGVLKLDLGNEWGKLFLVSFLGCLIGVALGMLVGSVGRWKEGTKVGIMLCVSLGSSFLSGLMIGGIKGLIEQHCPIINRINPASLISDAIYSIAIYQDPQRYTRNVITMAVLAGIFLLTSFLMVRRVRYDSI